MTREGEFDYIIVGSGAAGCVLANRLSADPEVRVLLLEAGGPDTDPRVHDPGGFVQLWGSELDWALTTEGQAALGGRRVLINQGRVAGGSTAINAMMYVRGNRRNYDGWAAGGARGWSFEEVLPYFRRSEDFEGGASEYHGVGGPLSVRACPDPASRSETFMAAAQELGYDGPYWDPNGARQEDGAGLLQFTVTKEGVRASAASAFLTPVRDRPNLTLKTRALATRLLLEGTRVVGVAYLQDGVPQQARAAREVVVSAGTFFSPKLLMLSGLGPADALRAHGLTPVVDLPGVGQNLQDHLQLPVVFASKVERPMATLLTGNVLFTRTRPHRPDAPPDLQLNFTPAAPAPLAPLLNLPGPVSIFLPILVQPDSVGAVRLRSSDPQAPPLVDPNYLQEDADVQVLRDAVTLVRELACTRAFAAENAGELSPGPGADVDAYIRAQCSTLWHPVGTCKLGTDEAAVVDPELCVRGVTGLRVADASVMPTVPSGNTQAACFMIGERVADLILGRAL